MRRIIVVVSMLGLGACSASQAPAPAPAPAPAAAGKPCEGTLSPTARKIYGAVQAGPTQGTLRERISSQTRDLVMEGEVKRSEARHSAEEAADCLRAP